MIIDEISSWISEKFDEPGTMIFHYTDDNSYKKINMSGGLIFHSHDVLNYKDKNNSKNCEAYHFKRTMLAVSFRKKITCSNIKKKPCEKTKIKDQ